MMPSREDTLTRSHHSKPGRLGPGLALGALLALALGALAPAAAEARPPRVSERPVVAGTPRRGRDRRGLRREWDGSPPPTASWQWMRCAEDSGDGDACRSIPGATATAYTVTEADLGSRLRVLLVLRNKDGCAWALSAESAAVAPAPAPSPTPSPSPEPALHPRRSPRRRPRRRPTAPPCSTRRPPGRRG